MNILESLSLAVKNIVSSKTRTLLTMLGIIIGVAAVIVIVGLGNGLEGYVSDSYSDMGTNTLTVMVLSRGSTRTMEVEDVYGIVAENSQYLDLCSPTASLSGSVKVGADTTSSSVTGVSEDYFSIQGYEVSRGRGLQYSDIATRTKVCVVGAYLDQAYFGGNAVGQTLRVGGQSLTIVGVLEQQTDELEEGGADDCLFLPYSTASRISGRVSSYVVTVPDEDFLSESKAALEDALYEFFESDDFYTVTSMSEMLETMTRMINLLVLVLAGIAAISLLVGGIGIMNIMLVTVTERTREIGIRRAIGAERSSIVTQFLIEAAMICGMGGIIGIAIGTVGTRIAGKLLIRIDIWPSIGITLGAFLLSVALGILFGIYPAAKASKLQPVEALRAE